jgi:RNA polymerase sigma-70 factor, ECF subfamily
MMAAISEQLVDIPRSRVADEARILVSNLFESARDDVYRYLLSLGLQPGRAQEAVQEVFLRLYTSLAKGDGIENPRAWVFRVAHNHGLKLRARQATETCFDAGLEACLKAPGHDAEHALLERERMLRLHHAIVGLSEQQRRCLHLRMQGLKYPEIGSVLGIGASTVGEFLRRAMLKLRTVRDE